MDPNQDYEASDEFEYSSVALVGVARFVSVSGLTARGKPHELSNNACRNFNTDKP
jgi:hypothetical protein